MSVMTGTAPRRTGSPSKRLGVGIDTSRYGHYAAFLREDLQPACDELLFAESGDGYAQLQKRLELLAARHPDASFTARLDAAGQYADNLLHFLRQLGGPSAPAGAALANRDITISCVTPSATRTTAPRCSAPGSPTPSRPAPAPATP
jgi:hypothetical protein